jgi:hypothetical protein
MAFPKTGGGYQIGDGNLNEAVISITPDPSATKTTAATLTMAELTSGLIPCTSSGNYSLTTMTGAEIDAYITNAKVGTTFDLAICHQSATNVVTLAGGTGVTVVGLATVTGITSGSFRFRRTGTAAWSAYRI